MAKIYGRCDLDSNLHPFMEGACKNFKQISTTGDPHIGCPKGGTWRQDPKCNLCDVCDRCGEGRA